MSKKDKNECDFCGIAEDEKNAFIVFRDEHTVSFLDKRPLFPGHCLLVPEQHIVTVNDLDDDTRQILFKNMQIINKAVEDAMNAEGTFVAINNTISQSVPHLHIHIVPRRKKDGLKGFFWPRNPYRDEQHMTEVRERIVQSIKKLA